MQLKMMSHHSSPNTSFKDQKISKDVTPILNKRTPEHYRLRLGDSMRTDKKMTQKNFGQADEAENFMATVAQTLSNNTFKEVKNKNGKGRRFLPYERDKKVGMDP